jgi:hypothetical protein
MPRNACREAFARAWQRWGRLQSYDAPETHGCVRSPGGSPCRGSDGRARACAPPGDTARVGRARRLPDRVALLAALALLPAAQRRAVVLHHVAGLSVQEVAEQTGAPAGTVRPGSAGAARRWPSSPRRRRAPVPDPDPLEERLSAARHRSLLPLADPAGRPGPRRATTAPPAGRPHLRRSARRRRLGGGAVALSRPVLRRVAQRDGTAVTAATPECTLPARCSRPGTGRS